MTAAAPPAEPAPPAQPGFSVRLDVFEGPFDLLLSLIAKRRLDVTLVALSQVTDEFIAYIRAAGDTWDLDQASEFLVVAATLLDLKVARLLPDTEPTDDEDLALLEARDLLFARLLQYRAFREVAKWLGERWEAGSKAWPRAVGPDFSDRLPPPPLELTVTPGQLADLFRRASAGRPVPVVDVGHLHAPTVSVREQAALLAERLATNGAATFRHLARDSATVMVVVARFLAVLDLYREGLVLFEQVQPLGELTVRWCGHDLAAALHALTDGPQPELVDG